MKLAALAAITLSTACDHARPIASCDDDLGGLWQTPAGAWMVIDNGARLEAYPIFADTPPASPGIVTAPRVLDLVREPQQLAGTLTRRFMRGAQACVARAAVHVTRCQTAELELVLADPVEPAFTADGRCTPTRPPPSRRERWRR